MTIQELREQSIPRWVRVIRTGIEWEVREIYYSTDGICCWGDKERNCYWTGNLSDVRLLTPVEYKGRKIAVGDRVVFRNDWYEVMGYSWVLGCWAINVVCPNDVNDTHRLISKEIESHDYGQTQETISIAGKKYDKAEFERATKDLKEIK